jgi:hypothetical protein
MAGARPMIFAYLDPCTGRRVTVRKNRFLIWGPLLRGLYLGPLALESFRPKFSQPRGAWSLCGRSSSMRSLRWLEICRAYRARAAGGDGGAYG